MQQSHLFAIAELLVMMDYLLAF